MPSVGSYLEPLQVGCGTPRGGEAAVHATRRYLNSCGTDKVVIKLDFSNAFNSISREVLLKATLDIMPQVFSFVESAYRDPSILQFADTVIPSEVGVQQGDPLGPILFSLTLQPVLRQLRSEFAVAYLDDVTIGGDLATVLQDLDRIGEMGAGIGLQLNLLKCEVISHNAELRDSVLLAIPQMLSVDPAHATLLGACLHQTGVTTLLQQRLSTFNLLCDRLKCVASHDALIILRNSLFVPRILYALRSSPCSGHSLLLRFDTLARSVLSDILNIEFTNTQWLQATLPINVGGLGVRSVSLLAPSAFLASAAGAFPLIQSLIPDSFSADQDADMDAALICWRDQVPNELPCPMAQGSQKAWDSACVATIVNNITNAASGDAHVVARWKAISSRGASAWLSALPMSSCGLRMSNECVRIAAGLRLGCTLCLPHQCDCNAPVEADGHHGLHCARSAGRHSRHNILNEIIKRALISAQIPSIREPRGMVRRDNKRPDGATLVPWARGKCLVWDVTVADTLAPSHVTASMAAAGAAAEKLAAAKKVKYAEIVAAGHIFVPLAFETFGSCASDAWRLVSEIGRRLVTVTGNPKDVAYLRQRISVAIQQGNAAAVLGTTMLAKSEDLTFM